VNFKTQNYLEHLTKTQTENKHILETLEQQICYIKIITQAINQAKHEGQCQNPSCRARSFAHTPKTEQSKHGERHKNNK